MEQEIARIKKSKDTDIVIRVDEYKGQVGVTIREFVSNDKFTGFTKQGTRVPAERWLDFKSAIAGVDLPVVEQAPPLGPES